MIFTKFKENFAKVKKAWLAPSKEDQLAQDYVASLNNINLASLDLDRSILIFNQKLKKINNENFEYILETVKEQLILSNPLNSVRELQKNISDIVKTKKYCIEELEKRTLHSFISTTFLDTFNSLYNYHDYQPTETAVMTRRRIITSCFSERYFSERSRKTKNHLPPFLYSVADSDQNTVKNYLAQGYSVKAYQNFALLIATEKEDMDMVKLLIDNGANYQQHAYEIVRFAANKNNKELLYYFLHLDNSNIQTIGKFIEKDYTIHSDCKEEIKTYIDRFLFSEKLHSDLDAKIDSKKPAILARKI